MTKYEFLNTLRTTLENELNSNLIQDHIDYYSDYINAEVSSGRSESDVITELGDPWAIAKNIIASEETNSNSYEEYSYNSSEQQVSKRTYSISSWWKKLLFILGIVGIVMIAFSIITGLISLIAPFIIPILIISFILKLFKKR